MKKLVMAAMLMAAAFVFATPRNAQAHDYQRGNDYPGRILVHPIHAMGTALEWMVMRPVHWFVSLPNMRIVFGHSVGIRADIEGREEVYFAWEEYR